MTYNVFGGTLNLAQLNYVSTHAFYAFLVLVLPSRLQWTEQVPWMFTAA